MRSAHDRHSHFIPAGVTRTVLAGTVLAGTRTVLACAALAAAVVAPALARPTAAHAQQAASDPPYLVAVLNDATIGADGAPGKAVPLFVIGHSALAPEVTIDATGLAGVATIEFPDWCTATGAQATCVLAETADLSDSLPLVLRPEPGVLAGATGTITYTSSAANLDSQEQTATITTADGPDVVVLSGGQSSADPGAGLDVPIEFSNAGNETAAGVQITFMLTHGLRPAQYANCTYTDLDDFATAYAVCDFTQDIEPDTTYRLTGEFSIEIGSDALGSEQALYYIDPVGSALALPNRLSQHRGPSAAPTLGLTEVARPDRGASDDIDVQDNLGTHLVLVENTLNLAAIGADVKGSPGAEVAVRVGVRNQGAGAPDIFTTADNYTSGSLGVAEFGVRVPAGLEVTEVPDFCFSEVPDFDNAVTRGEPGQPYYYCALRDSVFAAGTSYLVTFRMRINSTGGAAGTVVLDSEFGDPAVFTDDRATDNRAELTAGGAGGLPISGGHTAWLAGTGTALVALGVALVLGARRRRVRLVAPDPAG